MIHRIWYKIAEGYKKCSHKLCEHPWQPIGNFAKDKSKPDGLCLFCKTCQKKFRDKNKKKRYASAQAHNLKEYKKVRLKALNPTKRKCLRCGKMFDSTDETDRFCPKCKIAKKAKEKECEFETYGMME